jgi:hypothetical protein
MIIIYIYYVNRSIASSGGTHTNDEKKSVFNATRGRKNKALAFFFVVGVCGAPLNEVARPRQILSCPRRDSSGQPTSKCSNDVHVVTIIVIVGCERQSKKYIINHRPVAHYGAHAPSLFFVSSRRLSVVCQNHCSRFLPSTRKLGGAMMVICNILW